MRVVRFHLLERLVQNVSFSPLRVRVFSQRLFCRGGGWRALRLHRRLRRSPPHELYWSRSLSRDFRRRCAELRHESEFFSPRPQLGTFCCLFASFYQYTQVGWLPTLHWPGPCFHVCPRLRHPSNPTTLHAQQRSR